MVRATSPVISRERGPELVSLFEEYSRYAMMNWAEGRIQSMQGPTGRGRSRMRMRGREAAAAPRDMIPLNGHGETLAPVYAILTSISLKGCIQVLTVSW